MKVFKFDDDIEGADRKNGLVPLIGNQVFRIFVGDYLMIKSSYLYAKKVYRVSPYIETKDYFDLCDG